ncbi:VOC family protein [Kovacikia minuta CCNUW1]|uniref:VOC family protein n=1 Tax=Kovacikia minuta TaxID=2931930 RepID=UPI001CCB8A6C|nr:VOC family protein [Kovacikia minuta]UBF24630.1 VOC family protein [Kovacikia minuta CCNUW1]
MFDHIGLSVGNLGQSIAFYTTALAPLGIRVVKQGEGWAAMGKADRVEFWLDTFGTKQLPMHIAFAAENREQVRAFYAGALSAGGRDNGSPGIREIYHPNYYGAFVIDPDGHNVEAVCHKPEA